MAYIVCHSGGSIKNYYELNYIIVVRHFNNPVYKGIITNGSMTD